MKTCSKCEKERSILEFNKSKRAKDGLRSECKACRKEYREKNKAKKVKYDKDYYLARREEKLKYQKEYQDNNKEKTVKYKKEYYGKNQEEINKKRKEFRDKNKEKIAKQKKESYQRNKKNRNEYQKNYNYQRRKTNINFQIKGNLRTRIYNALHGNTKSLSTICFLLGVILII